LCAEHNPQRRLRGRGAKIYLGVFKVFHPLREVLGAHSRGPFDAVSGEALDFWRIRRFSLGRPFRAQMNFSPQIPRALALGWGWDAPLALGKGAVVECAVNGLRVCAPSTTRSGGFAEEGAKIYLDVFDVFHPLREVLGAHSRGPFDAVSHEALDFGE
jgi:hypothetical protein